MRMLPSFESSANSLDEPFFKNKMKKRPKKTNKTKPKKTIHIGDVGEKCKIDL